jgi:hypothetical protein
VSNPGSLFTNFHFFFFVVSGHDFISLMVGFLSWWESNWFFVFCLRFDFWVWVWVCVCVLLFWIVIGIVCLCWWWRIRIILHFFVLGWMNLVMNFWVVFIWLWTWRWGVWFFSKKRFEKKRLLFGYWHCSLLSHCLGMCAELMWTK